MSQAWLEKAIVRSWVSRQVLASLWIAFQFYSCHCAIHEASCFDGHARNLGIEWSWQFKEYVQHASFYGSRNKYRTVVSDGKPKHGRQKLHTRLLKLAKAFSILSGMGLMNEGQHRLRSLLRNHRPWSKRSYSRITQAGTLSRYKWINPWRHFCKRSQWLEKLGWQIFGASYRRHHLLGVCYQNPHRPWTCCSSGGSSWGWGSEDI